MSKEAFKMFARKNPELASVVLKGDATWQQLYELYEIYGENNIIWNNYLNKKEINNNTTSINDFINTFKNIDMESVQKGISNIQKTINLLQDIGVGSNTRAIYKRFE